MKISQLQLDYTLESNTWQNIPLKIILEVYIKRLLHQRTQNTVKNYGGTDFDKDVTIPPNSGLDSTEVTTFGITNL